LAQFAPPVGPCHLHGGIYGKGPLASFTAEKGASCRHRWRQISKAVFQAKAEKDFPAEWLQVAPFLRQS
jgi:hypothetical protein